MSFILEALKKSEQQRQEQNASQQKVRKRTLSLASSQPGRRPYWLLAGLLSLVLLCGWWVYSETGSILEEPPAASQVMSALPAANPPAEPAPPVTIAAKVESAPQPTVLAAEPAPVPKIYTAAPAVPAKLISTKERKPVVVPQRVDDVPATAIIETDAPVATAVIEQPQAFDKMPRYPDLSKGLRDRMPHLAMSMHFYNSDPDRRLVRINDRLLREGDLVSRDLELVEITPTGVILEFLGESFELLAARR